MKRIFFLCLLFPILVNAQFTNSGNGSWQNTPDLKSWRILFGSRGIVPIYIKYQVDSAEINNNASATPQAASFNINGSAKIGDTLQMNTGFSEYGYATTITTNHNAANAFQILNDNSNIFRSSLAATQFITIGNQSTRLDTIFGSLSINGAAISVSGRGQALFAGNTIMPTANGDTLAGAVFKPVFTVGLPIATLDSGSLVGGSGYVPATYTNVPLIDLTMPFNSGALATIVVGGGGAVTSVTITSGGIAYAPGDSMTANNFFLGGTGSGFTIPVATTTTYTGLKDVGTITFGGANLHPTTYAQLPPVPIEGTICAVTDSNTAVWGATAAGSGSNHVLLYFNGTSWDVFAK